MSVTEQPRDPLQAWPIIDGPMQGQNWAHADDYFYAAEVVVPGLSAPPPNGPAQSVPMRRTLYRLRLERPGFYVWSSVSE